jgi:hypothetical protein
MLGLRQRTSLFEECTRDLMDASARLFTDFMKPFILTALMMMMMMMM